MPSTVLSTEISDPINARILAVSEDRIAGFHEDPFAEIARLSGLPVEYSQAENYSKEAGKPEAVFGIDAGQGTHDLGIRGE